MKRTKQADYTRDVALGWLSETLRVLYDADQVDAGCVLGALAGDIVVRLHIFQLAFEWFREEASADDMLEALGWAGWSRIANVIGHSCARETRMKPTRRQKYLSSAQRGLQAFDRWLAGQLELADADVTQGMSGFLEDLLDDRQT